MLKQCNTCSDDLKAYIAPIFEQIDQAYIRQQATCHAYDILRSQNMKNQISSPRAIPWTLQHILELPDKKFMLHNDSIVNNPITFEINSIGTNEDRKIYNQKLKEYFKKNIDNLSDDSIKRLDKNPLRILDSKDKSDIAVSRNAPKLSEFRSEESNKKFNELIQMLKNSKIPYLENPFLVRGLDYYNDFTFEIVPENSKGSQDALGGGGQYDNLSKLLGGKDINGVGVAFGVDRIMELS